MGGSAALLFVVNLYNRGVAVGTDSSTYAPDESGESCGYTVHGNCGEDVYAESSSGPEVEALVQTRVFRQSLQNKDAELEALPLAWQPLNATQSMQNINQCSSPSIRISSEADCKAVATSLSKTWKGTDRVTSAPWGCYMYKHKDMCLVWGTNRDHSLSAPVCWRASMPQPSTVSTAWTTATEDVSHIGMANSGTDSLATSFAMMGSKRTFSNASHGDMALLFPAWDWVPPTSQQIYVLHMPKCAGVSLVEDLSKIVGRRAIWSIEGSYYDRIKGNFSFLVTMLRNPRDMVYSEYRYCNSAEFYKYHNVTPIHQSFESWVSTWADMWNQGLIGGLNPGLKNRTVLPFGCYWPVNLLTRAFTSPAMCENYGQLSMKVDAGVEAAIGNMLATDVVGLLEAYQESICLFHAVYQGILPLYCNCTDSTSWSTFRPTHEDHGHGDYRKLRDYPSEVVNRIDLFTAEDRVLYNHAIQRFLKDVRAAEARFGMKILCRNVPLA